MSHFSVLVIGESVSAKLAPYQENNMENCPKKYLKFNDIEDSSKKEYKEGLTKEFYCASASSWGQGIDKDVFLKLKTAKIGSRLTIKVSKKMDYFKLNKKYRGYYTLKNGKRCKGSQWFEVVEIIKTTHPVP